MSIISDVKSAISNAFKKIEADLAANPVAQLIESDFKLAVSELEKVAVADLENAVKSIGLAVLQSLVVSGANPSAAIGAAIAAGVASAESAFKAIGHDISSKTLNTLVTTVVNQVSSSATATAA